MSDRPECQCKGAARSRLVRVRRRRVSANRCRGRALTPDRPDLWRMEHFEFFEIFVILLMQGVS